MLVATSWAVIGLLVTRALAHRYGLRRPAWASVPVATRATIRPVGRMRASRHPAPAAPPVTPERDWYELVGGPVGER